jgi:hypothetical protein
MRKFDVLKWLGCAVFFYSAGIHAQDDVTSNPEVADAADSENASADTAGPGITSADESAEVVDSNSGEDREAGGNSDNSMDADTGVDSGDTVADAAGDADDADVQNEKSGKDEESEFPFFRKLMKKSKRDVAARLFGYYKITDKPDVPRRFELDTARLNLSWRYGRALEAVVEYDFAGLVKRESDGVEIRDGLRDAYIRIEPVRWFGFQMGHFKKPFSRLELTSRRKLSTISRGEANDYALGFLDYGGRDIGAMISGRLIKSIKLEYAASVFNGGGIDNVYMGTDSLDYVFRLESRPLNWLSVGASFSARVVEEEDFEEFFDATDYEGLQDPDFPDWLSTGNPDYALLRFTDEYKWLAGTHVMGELDLELRFGGFEAIVETMLGENWWFEESPYLWSISSLFSYRFPLFEGAMAVEPVLFAELLHIEDPDWAWRVRMVELNPGVNVHFGEDVRLMIHGQLIWTQGVEADIDEAPLRGFWPGEWPGAFADSRTLFIQVGFAN